MRLLVIEDEHLAAKRLIQMVSHLYPETKVCAVCDSVEQAVEWIKTNPEPDFAFFDIQLGDGISFEIFEQCTVNFPIIFTTAYDQYAIQAFKVNSLDYLLKPIDEQELKRAVDKFINQQQADLSSINKAIEQAKELLQQQNYKNRFLIKVGEHLRMIETTDISFFYSEDKSTFIRTTSGSSYALDQSLEHYEIQVNPADFYRISRKYIIKLSAITDMISYSNSRLKLKLNGMDNNDEIIVSRERVKSFKTWLEGEL
ncbi:response regulator transcription factor [Carboxylicivirga sp. A043]|uniref:LytR/AlgR family response regulator transcription factor n=1 Tax=Carboxylicivirga litoralis TaxID=2816963 RepID=UPI0021CB96CD|nr:LytTR family DNA-binding domain-containing protein [Carboxylicivirga sp. A043]MCU4156775.1 response regulator transcription factor [Carboxylicivirga sp. A043]